MYYLIYIIKQFEPNIIYIIYVKIYNGVNEQLSTKYYIDNNNKNKEKPPMIPY